jgi:hypothetical protein
MAIPYQLHHKIRQQQRQQQDQEQSSVELEHLIKDCKGKPFWSKEHNGIDCCFNCIIGWPIKNDIEHPIYDYEINLVNDIENYQHIRVLKASGLGITELVLRYMAWCCLVDPRLTGKEIHIIAGLREEFANELKERMERLFRRKYDSLRLESKYTELVLNQTKVRIFPTKQIKDLRGHVDVAFIFVDEADHFDPREQEELPYVIKRYEEKSKAKIIMVSTPNRPDGLFQSIDSGKTFRNFFHDVRLNYEWGLGKIYDTEFIERERNEPEFEREYNLKYLGKVGNVFTHLQIDKVIQLGEQYKAIPTNDYTLHSVGVDFGFSSSRTAVVLTEFLKEQKKIRILDSQEFEKANPQDIVDFCFNLYRKHWNTWFFVDGANRAAVNLMKVAFSESLTWETSKEGPNPEVWKVLPVNFATEHKQMLSHLHMLINKEYLAIPDRFDKLILSLRTAYAREYSLDKEQTSYSDSLDALRLACKMYKMR